MSSKVTYRKQYTRCGKERCRKCKEGDGHGPYWYAYWSEKGRTVSKYIGIHLPPDIDIERQAVGDVGNVEAGKGVPLLAANQSPHLNKAGTSNTSIGSAYGERLPLQLNSQVLRIFALGQFRVERLQGNEWVADINRTWHRRRARALLGCLLSSPARRLGREQAMEALWPDLDMETAANRLNGAVHELRQILGPEIARPAASHMLRLERDVLELADRTQIWVDAEAFESVLKEANSLLGIHGSNQTSTYQSLDIAKANHLEQLIEVAAVLYTGDYLLEELYSEWAAPRREALKRGWTGLLLKLAELREARMAYASAMEPLNRLLATDPTDETAVQRLLILLTQLDRRGEALNTYRRLASRLERTYDSEPLQETRELYEKLLMGQISNIAQPKFLISHPANIQDDLETQDEKQVKQSQNALTQNGAQDKEALAEVHVPHQSQDAEKTIAHVVAPFVGTSQLGRYNQSPLIGRERELETMRRIMVSFKGEGISPDNTPSMAVKNPHVLLLMGEAGIGKTRLAEELSHEANTRGWAVAWTRAYEQESAVPYRPWIELLRTLLQHIPAALLISSVSSRANTEAASTEHYTPTLLERLSTLLPELRDILPQHDRIYPHLPPEQERLHLWEATAWLLSTLSKTTPLLLVLDDLHWTDGSSRELFAYITRHLRDERILLLGTCRDVELSPDHGLRTLIADLRREQAIVTVAVQPLTQSQIGTLVAHLPQNIVHSIQTQAAGNPFFAEELARMSEAAQAASVQPEVHMQETSSHKMGHTAEGEHLPVSPGSTLPEGITAVLERRLGRLSSECQALLGKAAVLGGSFEFGHLLFMANEHPEDMILDLLEEALRAGLLTEEGAGSHIIYHFWHPLMVSHLYEHLSAARCAQLHRRAASALSRAHQGHEGEIAAAITYHLSKGGAEPTEVAHYAELAGNQAYSLSAFAEAEQYYIQAIQTITHGKLPFKEDEENAFYSRIGRSILSDNATELTTLQQATKTRWEIQAAITGMFAAEDEGLRAALTSAKQAGLPEIQISPIQGKFLQLLAAMCNAHKILEIGALAGYSGIWLARALPAGGRLISLEVNPDHARVVQNSFEKAGVADRSEVRVGKALDLLPALQSEAPFDLVFIDADKPPYAQYLDWALRLSRPGSIIVADNCIRSGKVFKQPEDEGLAGITAFNERIASDPRLVSLLLPMDDDYTDGFAVAVVKQQ